MRASVAGGLLVAVLACGSAAADLPAESPLAASGVKGGLVVQLGCGDGKRTAALAADRAFLVQGLHTDPACVAAARSHIQSRGLGGRVTAAVFDGRHLPYVDNLVNVLVVDARFQVAGEEMARVLAPGGVALVPSGEAAALAVPPSSLVPRPEAAVPGWSGLVKPWPDTYDQWTHFLHGPDNNAVSHDRAVGPPRRLQWVSDPVYGRDHGRLASLSAMVSANGRLFSIEDRGPAVSIQLPADWRLIARDAFNGVTLWEAAIDRWQSTATGFRSGPVQLPRRLAAVGDRVYVALNQGGPLTCLDAATGAVVKSYDRTEGVDEILYSDRTLYLVASPSDGQTGRRILAVAAQSGDVKWQRADGPARGILPGTLAVGRQRLFFHDGQAVVAVDRTSGELAWRKPLPSVAKRPSWSAPTLVFHDGVVLCGDRAVDYPARWKQHKELLSGMLQHGGLALLTALSAEDGRVLWQDESSECFHNAVDVFVIDGLVWASRGPACFFFERTRPILAEEFGDRFYIENVTGRDLRTGAVKRSIDAAEAFTLSHHHRCYRDKATDRYLIMGRTGVEFIDLAGGPCLRHNWTRGMCQYGVMPANGLLYVPPHPCACYNASKMNGFFAYSSRQERVGTDTTIERLQTTKANDGIGAEAAADDWPTYRHDNGRTGCGRTTVSDRLTLAWRRNLPGRLTAPTSADGKVFLAAVDRHTVFALDLANGRTLWSYVAGARVDSPPTYWKGRVYFGSADGVIRCLDATDGRLVWRFLAAPWQESIVVRDQLESPWPVAGSVLVQRGTVFALAGRSSNLDGGMYFVRLDARTGQRQTIRQIYDRDPKTGRQAEQRIDDLYMPGLLYDIPSSDGTSLFVREARLSLDGTVLDASRAHLYNPGGFLDATWWHRYYMIYGTRFRNGPGRGIGRSGGAPSGRLLVRDGNRVYGYGRSSASRYHLFCAASGGADPASRPSAARRGNNAAAGAIWSDPHCPIMVRAMISTRPSDAENPEAGRLVIAGPPDEAYTNAAALRGRLGGRLAVVDAATGSRRSEAAIPAPPVFDGMCAARGRIVLSLTSDAVVAYKTPEDQ